MVTLQGGCEDRADVFDAGQGSGPASAECFDLTLSPGLDDLDRLVSFLDRDLPAG